MKLHPITEKAKFLLELVSSSNENESRTSAYLAAKLIQEHKLLVLHPDDLRGILVKFQETNAHEVTPMNPQVTKRVRARDGTVWDFYEKGPGGQVCLICRENSLRGQAVYQNAGGMIHLACWGRPVEKPQPIDCVVRLSPEMCDELFDNYKRK